MSSVVQIKDIHFEISIPSEQILKEVKRIAEEINRDLDGKNPIFLVILNGAFMFASDLMKEISIPCEISFVKLASYHGTQSTGKVKELIGLHENLENRTVVVVEDIVDTGITMSKIIHALKTKRPKEIHIATFFNKPEALQKPVKLDYVGMHIPNDFIVGYGLDYDGYGRNLKDIYTRISE
jgi:hypoxanthine phosphoribosyltransferase